MKIEVDGVTLTVTQHKNFVTVTRVVGRDRKKKVDIKNGRQFKMPKLASEFVDKLRKVAKLQTARCTCGYHYGQSDHYEHCQSIYVARDTSGDYWDD
jgi:hypothetical protein